MILKTEYREEFAGHAWRWEGEAFGNTPASGSVSVNLRFPGQYYDAETNLHYNHFRYYDPELGRYITSDPIGTVLFDEDEEQFKLNHLYAYAESNPLRYIDPLGLAPICAADKKKDNCGTLTKIAKRLGRYGQIAILVCRLLSKTDDEYSGGTTPKRPKRPPPEREIPTEPKDPPKK